MENFDIAALDRLFGKFRADLGRMGWADKDAFMAAMRSATDAERREVLSALGAADQKRMQDLIDKGAMAKALDAGQQVKANDKAIKAVADPAPATFTEAQRIAALKRLHAAGCDALQLDTLSDEALVKFSEAANPGALGAFARSGNPERDAIMQNLAHAGFTTGVLVHLDTLTLKMVADALPKGKAIAPEQFSESEAFLFAARTFDAHADDFSKFGVTREAFAKTFAKSTPEVRRTMIETL